VLTLHFDYPSPASAVALLRLQRVADAGGRVAFSGIDAIGLRVSVPPTLDLLAELERHRDAAAALGLELRRPSCRPPTLAAHLVGGLAEARGIGASWRSVCLEAYWVRDVDLGDEEALRELAATAGLADDEVVARLADRELRLSTHGRMTTRRRQGIGGVPVLEADGVLVSPDLPDGDLRQLAAL
jgi:2-hydroxychromene-2-carboxylate isomerase